MRRALSPSPISSTEPSGGAEVVSLPSAGPRASFAIRALRSRRTVAVVLDALATAAALGALTWVGATMTLPLATALSAGVIVAGVLCGLYRHQDLRLARPVLDRVRPAAEITGLMVMALLVGAAATGANLPALEVLQVAGALMLAQLCAHVATNVVTRPLLAPERQIVVGSPAARENFRRQLAISNVAGVEIVREFTEAPAASLATFIQRHEADRVIVLVDGDGDAAGAMAVAREARSAGVKISVSSAPLVMLGTDFEVEQVGAGVMLHAAPRPGTSAPKRVLDLVGAVLGLVFLSPVLTLFAILIKLDSPGPVFFRQRRVGRDGEIFEIVKFRTMVADAERRKAALRSQNEACGLFKMKDDPRITRVGKILRTTSLDELPQLINVLRGQMSLVGPRPLVPDEDEAIAGWTRQRLSVSPGMTGPWQVMGSARIGMDDMAVLDNLYVSDRTIWYDLRMLLRTAAFVVARRGI